MRLSPSFLHEQFHSPKRGLSLCSQVRMRHSALREQHLLLVLDTFEQVIAAAPLLCACCTKRFL